MKKIDKEEIIEAEIEEKEVVESSQDEINNNDNNVKPIETSYAYNNYYNVEKNNGDAKKITLLIISLLVIAIIAGLVVFTNKDKNIINNKGGNAELKYTETSKQSEGVYVVDVSEVVENVMPSIVAITSETLVTSGQYGPGYFGYNQDRYSKGAGSGIIVSKTDTELMILTNQHVIDSADKLSVQFINEKTVNATIKGYSKSKDVAIVSVKLKDLDKDTIDKIKIATMGSSKELKVGQGIIAIGNALGYGQSVTVGVISALNRQVSIDTVTMNMIQIDAAINGGNSGGALLNSKGEVIGINSAKYSSNSYSSSASIEGMGFAIPISDVSELITNLMNGNILSDEERGYLGVTGYIITDEMSEYYSLPKGFYVSSIISGTDASRNLEIGNIITEVDGAKVSEFSDISSILESKKAKDKVKVKIKYVSGSEYKEKTVNITLASYKEVNR